EVFGEHLEQLALAWVDRAPGRAVVDDKVSERPLAVLDGADHDRNVGLVDVRGRLGNDRDAVVAERRPELLGDGGRDLLRIELSDDRAGGLPHAGGGRG